MSKKILVPLSGGKDSTACLIYALNKYKKKNIYPVFNDTGWEHPLTYKYLKELSGLLKIKIYKTKGHKRGKTLYKLIKNVGKFPFGRGRFCTMYLKQYALRDWYKENLFDGNRKTVFLFGIRKDESAQRAKKYFGIEPNENLTMEELFPRRYSLKLQEKIIVRLPVINWNREKIFSFLKENKVPYNPLYDEGTNDRVGCYPCLLAGKKKQKLMFETKFGKKRLKLIKKLEKKIGKKYEMYDTDYQCEICKL